MKLLFLLFCAFVQSAVSVPVKDYSKEWNTIRQRYPEPQRSTKGSSEYQTQSSANHEHAGLVEGEEYLLLLLDDGNLMFLDANSFEVKAQVSVAKLEAKKAAIVDGTIYAISPFEGKVFRTSVEQLIKAPNSAKWVGGNPFYDEHDLDIPNALVKGSFIYFLTGHGALYQYDTVLENLTKVGKVKSRPNSSDGPYYMVMINNIIYIYSEGYLSSFDGSNLKEIGVMKNLVDIFTNGTNICGIESRTIFCFDLRNISQPVLRLPHKFYSTHKTISVGSNIYFLNPYGDDTNIEIYNTETKLWSKAQNPLDSVNINIAMLFKMPKEEQKATKKEYIMLLLQNNKTVIMNANSHEQVSTYNWPEKTNDLLAVVENKLYSINTLKGQISSIDIENIQKSEDNTSWILKKKFTPESNSTISNTVVNNTFIYFLTYSGKLWRFDTKSLKTKLSAKLYESNLYASMVLVNNVLYIHTSSRFFSYDGSELKELKTQEKRFDCGLFQYGNNVCLIGGRTNSGFTRDVSCYIPSNKKWIQLSKTNENKLFPLVGVTKSGTHVFKTLLESFVLAQHSLTPFSNGKNNVEKLNEENGTWNFVQSPLNEGDIPYQVVTFTVEEEKIANVV